ncbi:MAG TPA: methyltransferase domain-containing protein [Drouetiella sp.]
MSQVVGPDGAEMRERILSLIDWRKVNRVLDVGCGVGYDLYRIGELTQSTAGDAADHDKNEYKFFGIDVSSEKIDLAKSDKRHNTKYDYRLHDFSEPLPFENNYFDVVYSHNVLECAQDKHKFLAELHRILKPGGSVLIAHFDWDSAIYNGTNKQLIRKVIHTFADWKQDWMNACDGWMGRRLWGTIEQTKLFVDAKLTTHQIVNDKYEFPLYGYKNAGFYSDMVAHGLLSDAEYQEFKKDIEATAKSGDYLFCITSFIYRAKKSTQQL